jgi:hypothetical protein
MRIYQKMENSKVRYFNTFTSFPNYKINDLEYCIYIFLKSYQMYTCGSDSIVAAFVMYRTVSLWNNVIPYNFCDTYRKHLLQTACRKRCFGNKATHHILDTTINGLQEDMKAARPHSIAREENACTRKAIFCLNSNFLQIHKMAHNAWQNMKVP